LRGELWFPPLMPSMQAALSVDSRVAITPVMTVSRLTSTRTKP